VFCIKCGNKIDDGVNFCSNCGVKIERNFTIENIDNIYVAGDKIMGKKDRNLILWFIIGFIILGLGLCLFLKMKSSSIAYEEATAIEYSWYDMKDIPEWAAQLINIYIDNPELEGLVVDNDNLCPQGLKAWLMKNPYTDVWHREYTKESGEAIWVWEYDGNNIVFMVLFKNIYDILVTKGSN